MNTSLFLHSTYRWMVLSFLKRLKDYCIFHCVKSIRIRRFSDPYFPVFGLNTERSEVSPRIQSKCRKKQTWKTPNMDTFHAVFWPLIWLKRSSHLREGCTYEAVKKKVQWKTNLQKQLSCGVLKIYSRFTGEHPWRSALQYWCCPVKLLNFFRTTFPKNTSTGLLLNSAFCFSLNQLKNVKSGTLEQKTE